MANKRDYYEVLGVGQNASQAEIKRAFRTMARQYHPDINKEDGSGERFKEINEAYEVLSDENKRAAYDRFGHAGVNQSGGQYTDFSSAFSDIFEEFLGGFGTRRRRRGPRRGADLRHDVNITFEESVFGVEKEIEITRPEICDRCYGNGAEPGTNPSRCSTCDGSGEIRRVQQSILGQFVNVSTCPACSGSGEVIVTPCTQCSGRKQVQRTRTKKVRIPAGISSDQQIRVTGEGATGMDGGPPGNLYVFVNVQRHEFFQRRGDDIMLNLDINVAQAALGDEVTVPTIEGDSRLKIPPGTQSGTVFRMRDLGVPRIGRSGRGDQLVMANVVIPTKLSDEQRDLFTNLAGTLGAEVIPQREKGLLNHLKEALGDVFGV